MIGAQQGILPFFIPHVGCPHICVFCNQHRIAGESGVPTVEAIKASLEKAIQEQPHKVWEIAFYGGSFTAIPKAWQLSFLEALEEYRKEGKINAIRCSTRPDALEEGWLKELKARGLTTIELGVQSMEDCILAKAKRGHSAEAVKKAMKLLKSLDFITGIQVMPGLPGETWNTLVHTAVEVGKLQPHFTRIYPVLVIEDTELADQYKAGLYQPLCEEEAIRYCTFLKTYWERLGIPVIRTGLQATEELDEGDSLLAGPYAPAMGELVVNEQVRLSLYQLLEELEAHFEDFPKPLSPQEGVKGLRRGSFVDRNIEDMFYEKGNKKRAITIYYHRRETSKVRGLKNKNVAYFEALYGPIFLWKEGELSRGQLCLSYKGLTFYKNYS